MTTKTFERWAIVDPTGIPIVIGEDPEDTWDTIKNVFHAQGLDVNLTVMHAIQDGFKVVPITITVRKSDDAKVNSELLHS